ncbi:epoxide hydrolase N-terminal domain-containing protein [Micromonospora sp. NBC_00617]|uniref:epoxide hydrolase N-terminal domain-containing protein n=1 Tax=Micromonospora sp. NBC_00617 TaxID=2903587 RepID=UPI0030DFA755
MKQINGVRPFRIEVAQKEINELRQRVKMTRWPDKETVVDRSQGVQLAQLRPLVEYWGTRCDWRKVEAKLNALPQFITKIDGLDIR